MTPTSTRTDDLRAATESQKIPADPNHVFALAIHLAEQGDFSMIKRLEAEQVERAALASTPSPPAGTGDVEGLRALSEKATPGPFSVSGSRTKLGEYPMLKIIGPDGRVWAYVPYSDLTPADHVAAHADAGLFAGSANYVRTQVLHPTAPGGSTGLREALDSAKAAFDGRPEWLSDLNKRVSEIIHQSKDSKAITLIVDLEAAVLTLAHQTPTPATTPPTSEGLDREAVARVIYDRLSCIYATRGWPLNAFEVAGAWWDDADKIIALRPTPTGDGDVVEAASLYFSRDGRAKLRRRLSVAEPFEIGQLIDDCEKLDAALAASKAQGGTKTAAARDVLAEAPNYSKDFQLMLVRIIQRHRNGRDLTETLKGAEDLLKRKGSLSVFRGAPPAATNVGA